jgi:excisionase family DNA binding protein
MKKRAFGTYDVARLCEVVPSTVSRWIHEGKLSFFTTAGGHRRVWDSDLRDFLQAHNIPIPSELATDSHKILIVGDDASLRRIMGLALQRTFLQIETIESNNGFEAGQKITELLPSLVILDVYLPGVDGYSICRMIHRDERLKHVKILVVSGDPADETRQRFIDAGADDFLAKPVDYPQLFQKVQQLLFPGPQTRLKAS